jgi:hypothetical protein
MGWFVSNWNCRYISSINLLASANTNIYEPHGSRLKIKMQKYLQNIAEGAYNMCHSPKMTILSIRFALTPFTIPSLRI